MKKLTSNDTFNLKEAVSVEWKILWLDCHKCLFHNILFIKYVVQKNLTCIWRSGPANCSVNLGISLDYKRKGIFLQNPSLKCIIYYLLLKTKQSFHNIH